MTDRIRQVEHVEGNFSTSVVIEVLGEDYVGLTLLRDAAKERLLQLTGISPNMASSYHLSLSRQVFLKPHMIGAFLDRITSVFKAHIDRGVLFLKPEFRVYLNESRDTAFLAVPVDLDISPKCLELIALTDKVLEDFDLPNYYANPSPHVSLGCVANSDGFPGIPESSMFLDTINIPPEDLDDFRVEFSQITVFVGRTVHRIHLT